MANICLSIVKKFDKNLQNIEKGIDIFYLCVKIKLQSMVRRKQIMAYVIGDNCLSCGACAADCPVEAISEGDGKFVIDADTCIECGSCAGTCPVEAISEG